MQMWEHFSDSRGHTEESAILIYSIQQVIYRGSETTFPSSQCQITTSLCPSLLVWWTQKCTFGRTVKFMVTSRPAGTCSVQPDSRSAAPHLPLLCFPPTTSKRIREEMVCYLHLTWVSNTVYKVQQPISAQVKTIHRKPTSNHKE